MNSDFNGLDNRLTQLSDMLMQDREERIARQQAKDKQAASHTTPEAKWNHPKKSQKPDDNPNEASKMKREWSLQIQTRGIQEPLTISQSSHCIA